MDALANLYQKAVAVSEDCPTKAPGWRSTPSINNPLPFGKQLTPTPTCAASTNRIGSPRVIEAISEVVTPLKTSLASILKSHALSLSKDNDIGESAKL